MKKVRIAMGTAVAALLIGAAGKVVKDANGTKAEETRTMETDADGRVTENVQAQPSVPPAN
ncbi:hypothetical protein [Streptomyces shenzhenensis]|uniref:Uncharacterized protein n=1 Tax=Streptomyces shenzhenensis TaxID=943815 RepID=A0A3M0IIJ2_9ACTN|nr:hypothetical protein [Streptomyces shenzhenensis]RMB86713.1 hypothetical protein CTZ28_06600 [Streptomyces shenzhenensis]